MSNLLICLPAHRPGATVVYEYALTSGEEHTLKNHSSAPAALLPAPDRGSEVVGVVPVAMLSWHKVELPQGVSAGSPRLRAVLDGLLEDRLLDEAEKLHFALAPAADIDGKFWVAACDRIWLREHMQALEASQRPVTRLVPEFAPDTGTTQLYAIGNEQSPQLVLTGKAAGGVMRFPLNASALAMIPATADHPQGVVPATGVFAEPAVAGIAEQTLGRKVELLTRPQRWVDAARSRWDLAQFDLTSSSRARTVKRLSGAGKLLWQSPAWRPARWGAALIVLANLIGLNAWAWKENAALQAGRAALKTTLTQTFPQVRVVVDPAVQMEREVAALRQATGAASERDLEAMLGALAPALPAGRVPGGIDYTGGEARIKGVQLSAEEASRLTAQLQGRGYIARLDGDTAIIKQLAAP